MRILVRPQHRNDAVRTLRSAIGPTKSKPGCLASNLYIHIDNDDDLLLIEKWESQAHLDNHIHSEQFRLLLETIELGKEEPLVEVHSITSTTGLEDVMNRRLRATD